MDTTAQPLERPRIWRVGLLTIVISIAATVLVRALAAILLNIPAEFVPLASPVPTIFWTVVGTGAGVGVFALVLTIATRPGRVFQLVAAAALILSFIPDLWLLTEAGRASVPGTTGAAVGTLMVQHVTAAAVVVWMLTLRGRGGRP